MTKFEISDDTLDTPEFMNWLVSLGATNLTTAEKGPVAMEFVLNDSRHTLRRQGEKLDVPNRTRKLVYRFWSTGGSVPKASALRMRALNRQINSLLRRDGSKCWYCNLPFLRPDAGKQMITREHLLPKVHKGPNTLYNMVLAHAHCNLLAGDYSVAEKVKIRDFLRDLTSLGRTPWSTTQKDIEEMLNDG